MTEDWMRVWSSFGALAPQWLNQPITLTGVAINSGNSSAPDTEAAILSKESYGRQLGKLLDAVAALVEEQPDRKDEPAFSELLKLRKRVEAAKHEAAERRVEQLRRDLALLSVSKPDLHKEMLAALRPAVD